MKVVCAAFIVALAIEGCTPGAAGSSNAGSAPGTSASVTTVDVNLTSDPAGTTTAGVGRGYAPLAATVTVGTFVRFKNSDGFAHTASSIAGTAFPATYPFSGSALTASGGTLSDGFTSGALSAGQSSQALLADRPGTYLFGCFFHYGTPMRATIVVQ